MNKLWHEGTIGIPKDGNNRIAHYWVKSYARKSQYGINGGKISKLLIRIAGETVADYDRGWNVEPDENDEAVQIAIAILMKEYN